MKKMYIDANNKIEQNPIHDLASSFTGTLRTDVLNSIHYDSGVIKAGTLLRQNTYMEWFAVETLGEAQAILVSDVSSKETNHYVDNVAITTEAVLYEDVMFEANGGLVDFSNGIPSLPNITFYNVKTIND